MTNSSEPADDDLLARLRAGEAEARRELFRRCQTGWRPYFRAKLPNADDVDDCVSEVVTRALEGISRGLEPEVLAAWLGGIARNVLKERYEAKERDKRHVEVPAALPRESAEPPLELIVAGDLPEIPSELEFLMGKRQLWAVVDDAVRGLPRGFGRIMHAHVRLSREQRRMVVGADLAAALDMSVTSLNRQLDRARKATHEAIVALVLARSGRAGCAELAAIVGDEERVVLDPARSRAVGRHAAGCVVCGERSREADTFSKWALGPGLIGLADDDEERRRAVIALFSRAGDGHLAQSPAALGAPLAVAPLPELGLVDRIRVGITSRVASMPDSVMQFAVHNPDALRRVVAAVAGVVLVAVAVVAAGTGDAPDSDAAPAPPAATTTTEPPTTSSTAPATPTTTTLTVTPAGLQGSMSREPEPAVNPGPAAVTTTVAPGTPTSSPTNPVVTSTPDTTVEPEPKPKPVRQWGYARINTQFDQYGAEQALVTEGTWGTWRTDPDPEVNRRDATFHHEGPGRYRLRLPGVGSANGIAHVSVNFWTVYTGASAWSCGVGDSRPDGPDQVVTVVCHNVDGLPVDARFDLLYTVPTPGGAPMAAVRYPDWTMDSRGGQPEVTRAGPGRYLVSLRGFSDAGYLQVTPFGEAPARCHNEDVLNTGVGVLLVVACHGPGGVPVDTGWQLTYVVGAPLTHDDTVPGAYAQMTGTAPGLRVEPGRSYNTANGHMTVQRAATGLYRVGFRSVGQRGDVLLATAIGPEAGHCHGNYLISYQQPGDTWAVVACTDSAGKPVDRRFGVAVVRAPGPLVGETGPVVPGPHPAGPRWGYARMLAHDIPTGVETQLDGQWQWTTWSRGVSLLDALWVRKATVIHQSPGRYRVRLPGIGSPTGTAHVTPFSSTVATCSIVDTRQDGVDELVDVACFGPTGAVKDMWFNVFFGTPGFSMGASGVVTQDPTTPTAYATVSGGLLDPARSYASNGETPTVTRRGTGRYTVSYTGLGNRSVYPADTVQVTALDGRRCVTAGWNSYSAPPAVSILVDCYDSAGRYADADFGVAYLRRPPEK